MKVNIPRRTFAGGRRVVGTLDLPENQANKLINAGLAQVVKHLGEKHVEKSNAKKSRKDSGSETSEQI